MQSDAVSEKSESLSSNHSNQKKLSNKNNRRSAKEVMNSIKKEDKKVS
jgi:hypothetical protein